MFSSILLEGSFPNYIKKKNDLWIMLNPLLFQLYTSSLWEIWSIAPASPLNPRMCCRVHLATHSLCLLVQPHRHQCIRLGFFSFQDEYNSTEIKNAWGTNRPLSHSSFPKAEPCRILHAEEEWGRPTCPLHHHLHPQTQLRSISSRWQNKHTSQNKLLSLL